MSSKDTADDGMLPEYDFSRAERGKHFVPDAVFHLPVYLDEEVRAFLAEKSAAKGISLDQLVNDLLRRDIDSFRSLS